MHSDDSDMLEADALVFFDDTEEPTKPIPAAQLMDLRLSCGAVYLVPSQPPPQPQTRRSR